MRALLLGAAAFAVGCSNLDPQAVLLGAKQMPGYYVTSHDQPGFSSTFYGFMVGADAANHYSIAWIDSPGGSDWFSGTVMTDGTFDPNSTFAHTGAEAVTFDAPNQITFASQPGRSLHGIDLVTSTNIIYLDARINKSHVGANVEFIALTSSCVPITWNTTVNPVAFTTDGRVENPNSGCR
jgi:hypothetical protein